MSKPHIVLIHGAWHRAWHWHLLKAKLEESGYTVTAFDLPSNGSDPDKLPRDGALRADTDAVKSVLEDIATQSQSIMPLFHSYGGVPGGEAVAELSAAAKKKIQRLVYLTAPALPSGTAVLTEAGLQVPEWIDRHDHVGCVPDPIPIFYSDSDPEIAAEAVKRLVPISLSVFLETTIHTPWLSFPSTYIWGTEDPAMPRGVVQGMFLAMKKEEVANWEFRTMSGGHSPFLTKPDEFAAVVRNIAGEDLDVSSQTVRDPVTFLS